MSVSKTKNGVGQSLLNFLQLILVTGVLASCGGGGGGASGVPGVASVGGSVAKGPISAGTVTVYPLNPDGSRGSAAIISTVTDSLSAYQLSVDSQSAGFVALVATGGSYVDEATGTTISLGPTDELEAYAELPSNGQIIVNITPLTTLAAAQARAHISNDGQTLANAVTNANAEIASVFDVGDTLGGTLPPLSDLSGASQQEINAVLLSAGLSQLAFNNGALTAFDILSEIVSDIEADGAWGNGTSFTPPSLEAATNQFLGNNPGITATLSPTLEATLAQAVIDIEAIGGNVAPTISGTPPTSVDQYSAYSFLPTATDVDSNILTFSILNRPAWASFDTATGALTGTPDDADVGTTTGIVISVSDGIAAPVSLPAFDLTVNNVNNAPTISGTPAPTITQGATYNFTPTAGDIDGDTLLFSITNKPAWASFDTATGALSGTPSIVGTTTGIVISVNDQQGFPNSSASLPAFNLTVTGANNAPTISGTPTTSVDEDSAYSFTPTSGDVDGDTLLFSITNKPIWASFDTATGKLSGTPANAHVGTSSGIVITVDDQQGAPNSIASLPAFDITVNNVNDTPNISGSPATRVGELASYSFTPTASDADPTGDTLLFSIINKPTWASFDTATGALTGTPTTGNVGTTSGIVISVDDQRGAPNSVASLPAFDISVLQGFNEALYATPTVSSFTSERRRYQANDGININLADPDTNASNGWVGTEDETSPSAQAWIQFDFDSTKTIYRVSLSDLLISDQVQQAIIEFSDGSLIPVTTPLPDDGTPVDFVFDPKQTDWIRVTETQATGGFGLAEFAAYSLLTPNQTKLAQDLFNDGNATGWSVNDTDCQADADAWSAAFTFWPGSGSGNQYQQTGQCRGFSIEGIEIGTYALLSTAATAGIDLRLSLRTDDDGTSSGWQNGAMGVLFGYQDHDNYYRLDLSQQEGHRKLIKKEAGVFTELNSSPQSYTSGTYNAAGWESTYPDAWVNLRVVQENGAILVYINGTKILAAADSTFSDGQVALFCARNRSCTFDNVVLLEGPTDPVAGVNIDDGAPHRSSEYFVTTGDSLNASAVLTSGTGVDSVEFVLDEGSAGEASLIDPFGPTYNVLFDLLPAGEHTLSVYLLDGSGQRMSDDAEASAVLPQLGSGGIHLVTLGDSIAGGLEDDVASDNISLDGRNTSGGFQPVLNDLLTDDNPGRPVTVLNEANAGETSGEAAARIDAVLERTPAAQAYLMTYGANDSGGGTPTPSGLGLSSGDSGYAGSFKDNMQQMIDVILAAGKEVYLSKTPPHLTDPGRDTRIQEYNDVIDELVTENVFSFTPPDFHAYYTANPGEMADQLHPNGVGYQSMARLWCDSLNQPGMLCGFPY